MAEIISDTSVRMTDIPSQRLTPVNAQSTTEHKVRAQQSQKDKLDKDSNGWGQEMSASVVRRICREKDLYDTPRLNDKLYLHYQQFRRIQHLDQYSGVRALFLECNALTTIENLECMPELRCLYLQDNAIERIQGLATHTDLRTLNLNSNQIRRVDNLDHLQQLDTLLLKKNKLTTTDDIQHLAQCKSIVTLDLSHNLLNEEGVLDVLAEMPKLACVYLKGNPFLQKISFFRKHLISRCKHLTFVDDRPVFENERRLIDAWLRGGREAEQRERETIAHEKDRKAEDSIAALRRYQARVRAMRERQKREAAEQAATDDDVQDGDDEKSDGAKSAGEASEESTGDSVHEQAAAILATGSTTQSSKQEYQQLYQATKDKMKNWMKLQKQPNHQVTSSAPTASTTTKTTFSSGNEPTAIKSPASPQAALVVDGDDSDDDDIGDGTETFLRAVASKSVYPAGDGQWAGKSEPSEESQPARPVTQTTSQSQGRRMLIEEVENDDDDDKPTAVEDDTQNSQGIRRAKIIEELGASQPLGSQNKYDLPLTPEPHRSTLLDIECHSPVSSHDWLAHVTPPSIESASATGSELDDSEDGAPPRPISVPSMQRHQPLIQELPSQEPTSKRKIPIQDFSQRIQVLPPSQAFTEKRHSAPPISFEWTDELVSQLESQLSRHLFDFRKAHSGLQTFMRARLVTFPEDQIEALTVEECRSKHAHK